MIDKLLPLIYALIGILTYIGAIYLLKWAIRKDVDRELEETWGDSYTQYKKKK